VRASTRTRARAWVLAAAASASASAATGGEWRFRVLLDNAEIGEHRFSVAASGDDERKVTSEANFVVRFLGIVAYRYSHKATERWRGNCLVELQSTTDDDGKSTRVHAEARDEASPASLDASVQPLPGCVMSFAYWNPSMRNQTQLFNAQTGRTEAVQVSRDGSGTVDVRGQPTTATRWRITGPARPVDVWYSAGGEWIGLDSTVAGGRKLSYRLK
jgi:hypothetical protein